MILRNWIQWEHEGNFIGIERLADDPDKKTWVILCDGKEKNVFDTETHKFLTNFKDLDPIEKKDDEDFAKLKDKICCKDKFGYCYKLIDNRIITRTDDIGNEKEIILDEFDSSPGKYKYRIFDMIVAGTDNNKLYCVGYRTSNGETYSGLFSILLIDFEF